MNAFLKKHRAQFLEWLGWAVLLGLAAYYLTLSWRKWINPQIDFGKELYLPWRIAQGAVLGRDLYNPYGPFSYYLNALFFRLFGPGFMVLVAANLAVFAAITVLIYRFVRAAWGRLAAWTAAAVFISAFGFSQIGGWGNYTYAAPYAHPTTHGFLVSLLLVGILTKWIETATPRRSLIVGILFGLTALLKPEFMLADGLMISAAVLLRRRQREGAWERRPFVFGIIGALAPTLFFFLYFLTRESAADAFLAAGSAWLNLFDPRGWVSEERQKFFLGLDHPWHNFLIHGEAFLIAVAVLTAIVFASWGIGRLRRSGSVLGAGAVLVGGIGWLSWHSIVWTEIGRCFLGLTLVSILIFGIAVFREEAGYKARLRARLRFFLVFLALVLLTRMMFNGMIYGYGYYQAALAGLLIPAVLIGETPQWFRFKRPARIVFLTALFALLIPGVLRISDASRQALAAATFPVGEGRDRFYTYPPWFDPTGLIIQNLTVELKRLPDDQTLLVLPDAVMINYLARKRCPLPEWIFYGPMLTGEREAALIQKLAARPPDWIVLRSQQDVPYLPFGALPGQGMLLIEWVCGHYQRYAALGGNPLENQNGAIILQRLSPPPKLTP